MSKEQDRIYVHRPFGPVFCEFSISEKTIINLNKWVDDLSKNRDLRKKLNYGKNLRNYKSLEFSCFGSRSLSNKKQTRKSV